MCEVAIVISNRGSFEHLTDLSIGESALQVNAFGPDPTNKPSIFEIDTFEIFRSFDWTKRTKERETRKGLSVDLSIDFQNERLSVDLPIDFPICETRKGLSADLSIDILNERLVRNARLIKVSLSIR